MDPISRSNVQVKFNDMTAYLGDVKSSQSSGEKAYVSPEGKISAKILGEGSKTLKAQDVSEQLHAITTQAKQAGILKTATSEQLSTIVSGLETLKGRIQEKQDKTPAIIKFILELFGVEDKSTKIINQIDKTIKIVKEFSLGHEIAALESDITTLEKEHKVIKTQLERVAPPSSKAQAIQAEIESLKSLTDIPALKREVERTGAVKGAKDFSIPGFRSDAQKAYQAAKENLEKAPRLAKELITKQAALSAALPAALKEDEISLQNFKSVAIPLQKKIDKLSKAIEEKQTSLTSKQAELKKLQGTETPSTERKISCSVRSPPENSAVMEILDTAKGRGVVLSIKAALGFDSKNMDEYIEYQHKTFFGFSVGQRQALSELTSTGVKSEDLETMLEGGAGVINIAYLALNVEEQLLKAKSEKKSPDYIIKLERMLSDLKRSLAISIQMQVFEDKDTSGTDARPQTTNEISQKYNISRAPTLGGLDKGVKEISANIKGELIKMKPGERLFIPIGAEGHATLLCFEKGKDGVVTPVIYNTGLGAEAFADISTQVINGFKGQKGQKAPTKIVYPAFEISQETKLEDKIGGLLKNTKDLDKNAKTDKQQLIATTKGIKEMYIRAEAGLGKGIPGEDKQVQISGVCSFQMLTEVAQDTLGTDYDQFQHDFLVQMGKEFKGMSDHLVIKDDESVFEKTTKKLKLHKAMLEDNSMEIQKLETRIATRNKNP